MRIVLKGEMPDGTCLQLEDWSENMGHPDFVIGAYPVSQNTGRWGWVKKGETFRMSLEFRGDKGKAETVFLELQEGRSLGEYEELFWHPKYKFYLGLSDTES